MRNDAVAEPGINTAVGAEFVGTDNTATVDIDAAVADAAGVERHFENQPTPLDHPVDGPAIANDIGSSKNEKHAKIVDTHRPGLQADITAFSESSEGAENIPDHSHLFSSKDLQGTQEACDSNLHGDLFSDDVAVLPKTSRSADAENNEEAVDDVPAVGDVPAETTLVLLGPIGSNGAETSFSCGKSVQPVNPPFYTTPNGETHAISDPTVGSDRASLEISSFLSHNPFSPPTQALPKAQTQTQHSPNVNPFPIRFHIEPDNSNPAPTAQLYSKPIPAQAQTISKSPLTPNLNQTRFDPSQSLHHPTLEPITPPAPSLSPSLSSIQVSNAGPDNPDSKSLEQELGCSTKKSSSRKSSRIRRPPSCLQNMVGPSGNALGPTESAELTSRLKKSLIMETNGMENDKAERFIKWINTAPVGEILAFASSGSKVESWKPT